MIVVSSSIPVTERSPRKRSVTVLESSFRKLSLTIFHISFSSSRKDKGIGNPFFPALRQGLSPGSLISIFI